MIIDKTYTRIDLPEELLISFAKSLVPEIRAFYHSDAGNEYYAQWLTKHPEYAPASSVHSTVNTGADKLSAPRI